MSTWTIPRDLDVQRHVSGHTDMRQDRQRARIIDGQAKPKECRSFLHPGQLDAGKQPEQTFHMREAIVSIHIALLGVTKPQNLD